MTSKPRIQNERDGFRKTDKEASICKTQNEKRFSRDCSKARKERTLSKDQRRDLTKAYELPHFLDSAPVSPLPILPVFSIEEVHLFPTILVLCFFKVFWLEHSSFLFKLFSDCSLRVLYICLLCRCKLQVSILECSLVRPESRIGWWNDCLNLFVNVVELKAKERKVVKMVPQLHSLVHRPKNSFFLSLNVYD